MLWCYGIIHNSGRIRLSVSTVNRTYDLLRITHVTPFPKYRKHSTGPSTYGPWARTYSKLFSCEPILTVCSYGAQSNEICTEGCHVGLFREFVGTACCTYGQSNTTILNNKVDQETIDQHFRSPAYIFRNGKKWNGNPRSNLWQCHLE